MRLTRYTDYSLRVLIYLATHDDRACAIAEIAKAYDISYNHLMKVANGLARAGFLDAVRGRGGGLKLRIAPEKINVGAVIRTTEEGFALADCAACVIAPACGLTAVLNQGAQAMLKVFDRHTIADLVERRSALGAIFGDKGGRRR